MTISAMDWISLAVGVVGVIFGIYQIFTTRKIRDIYRDNFVERYKKISEIVSNLTENIIAACEIIKTVCNIKSGPCSELSQNISGSMDLARQLIRFCRSLDEEYKTEFHKSIDPTITEHFDSLICRCGDVPAYLPTKV